MIFEQFGDSDTSMEDWSGKMSGKSTRNLKVRSANLSKSGSCTSCSGQLVAVTLRNSLLTKTWKISAANVHIRGSCTFCSGQLGGNYMSAGFAKYLEGKLGKGIYRGCSCTFGSS